MQSSSASRVLATAPAPSGAASSLAASAQSSEGATTSETVSRPEPGLARGKWEAPAWAFWAALAVVVVASALYVLKRMGLLKMRASRPSPTPTNLDHKGSRPL